MLNYIYPPIMGGGGVCCSYLKISEPFTSQKETTHIYQNDVYYVKL